MDQSNFLAGNGIVTTDIASGHARVTGIALQPDGLILLAGSAEVEDTQVALARYLPDGALDSGFGDAGVVLTDLTPSSIDMAMSVRIQADGRIVVAGADSVARYLPNGELDRSFGLDGRGADLSVGAGNYLYFNDLYLQEDGKIVVVGMVYGTNPFDMLVARYNTNGTFDTSFNGTGFKTIDLGARESADCVLVQPDGKILLGGTSFSLVRLNADGTPDTSFGGDGTVTTELSSSPFSNIYDLAIQPNGQIVVAGMMRPSDLDVDFAVARYNADGSLDSSFGSGGVVTTDFGGIEGAHGLALQDDGSIVVVGTADNAFAVTRYLPTGALDTSFNGTGKLVTDLGERAYATARDVVIQSDGRILVAGNSHDSFTLVRYNPDGSLAASAPAGLHLVGTSGDDTLRGGAGDDTLEGGDGIDVAQFQGSASQYAVVRLARGFLVSSTGTREGNDTVDVERLHFADINVALDLDGNAGAVARILGVVFGAESLNDPRLVGIGLDYADRGLSLEQLAEVALETRLGVAPNKLDVVRLLHTNLYGTALDPQPPADHTTWIDALPITPAILVVFAAHTPLNSDLIGLQGLAATGLEYL
jgi:uncharacterized delta-60 repeat protein